MPKVYFGKFDKNKPEQLENKFYAAGAEGNSWYGGIQPGDYVFPVSDSKVLALWKVNRYDEIPNRINLEDSRVVLFDVVREFKTPVTVQQFIKCPYFDFDINLLNKISKATNGRGFFEILTTPLFPMDSLETLQFENERNIYVVLSNHPRSMARDNDLFVVVNNLEETKIERFEKFQGNKFVEYLPLGSLYTEKNAENQRYTLKQLFQFAKKDEASNKEKYLSSVLEELQSHGHFAANNPIRLYDNILVGRLRTPKTPAPEQIVSSPIDDENDIEFESLEPYMKYADLLDFNPNLILYGPPGTGKTYATKKIIEAYEMKNYERPCSLEQADKEGRVKFITFHQSYSYEEFIEGIRPEFADDSDRDSEGELRYRLRDGILKDLVKAATTQLIKAESASDAVQYIKPTSRIWKVSLGRRNEDDIYNRCKEMNFIAVGWHKEDLQNKGYEEIYELLAVGKEDYVRPTQDASSLNSFVNEMTPGDIVFIYDSPSTIRDIGVITGDYQYKAEEKYTHTREVLWLMEFEEPHDILEMNDGVRLTLKTVYELGRINLSDVQRMISSIAPANLTEANSTGIKPYYLIIDEINRGNISKIFGELITLIEKDKRATTQVTLPYSQKPFSIPKNLFLIGTMNTADRSIAMLDTALRRRFSFVEIEPDYTVFSSLHPKVNNSVDVERLLKTINDQIVVRLDREHRIGHAYLMDVITLNDLYKAWYFKILPLLMEYFYNDTATIESIIGKNFFDKDGSYRFLKMTPVGQEFSEFEQAMIQIYTGRSD